MLVGGRRDMEDMLIWDDGPRWRGRYRLKQRALGQAPSSRTTRGCLKKQE